MKFVAFIKSTVPVVILALSAYGTLECKFDFRDNLVQE